MAVPMFMRRGWPFVAGWLAGIADVVQNKVGGHLPSNDSMPLG